MKVLAFSIEIVVGQFRKLFRRTVVDVRCQSMTYLGWKVSEDHFFPDVINCDVLGLFDDLGEELRRPAAVSTDAVEQSFCLLPLSRAVFLTEVGQKIRPCCGGWGAEEETVQLWIEADINFVLQEGKLVLRRCDGGPCVCGFHALDPHLDVGAIKCRKIWLAVGANCGPWDVGQCRFDGAGGDLPNLFFREGSGSHGAS